ncbi:MAG: PhoU domain-containing protein, partial [Candidatus Thorarchaeota archaeon]
MNPQMDSVIAEIISHLEKLHGMATATLTQAMKAFEDLDIALAELAMSSSDDIENLHHTIEDMAFGAISTFHPHDIDLRRLIA